MKPSETSRGSEWLTNFLPEDQWAAQALIDSIMFVSLSTMRPELVRFLQELMATHQIESPALVLPALSIEDINAALSLSKAAAPRLHIAYKTYTVGAPISVLPGSEGLIGNAIRDLFRGPPQRGSSWLAADCSLEDLRSRKCRSIVFVSDYAGSGTQIAEFARTFTRNSTIRSWRSGGYLKLHAVVYVASPVALNLLTGPKAPLDSLYAVRASPTFADRPWGREERLAIEQLCIRKADRHSDALGYKESRGLLATEAGAPNNLPRILRQLGPSWRPFFEGRTVPPELALELGDYAPKLTNAGLADLTQQARLASALELRRMRPASADLLRMLALLQRSRRRPYDLAAATSMPVSRVLELLQSLRELQLIDDGDRLTARGMTELRSSKRIPRQVSFVTSPPGEEYYPRSMR